MLEGLVFLQIAVFCPIWTRLRSWGFGGGAVAWWADKRFVGDGGERCCSSRQRRKPWEASSPWNKTNKWAQWFKEGGTMRADGWAETRLSLQCPGSTSRPGLR